MSQAWDRIEAEDLANLQRRRLVTQIRNQLYAFSPYYRRILDELGVHTSGVVRVEDLAKLPLVSRETLAESPEAFVLEPETSSVQRWGSGRQITEVFMAHLLGGVESSERRLRSEYTPVHALQTLGGTGSPITVRLSRRDLAVLATQGKRLLEVAGVEPETPLVNLLHPSEDGAFWPVWLGAVAHAVDQRAVGPLDPQEAAEVARETRARTLVAPAADALSVFEAAGDKGLPELRRVILAPEVVTPLLYRRLREASSGEVRVVRTYAFAEGRAVRAECAEGAGMADSGYHTYPSFEFFEIISRLSEEKVGGGRAGELVFTGLDQRGTALARYRPGDVAMGGIDREPCRWCGRTVPRIIGPIIRAENLLEMRSQQGEPLAVDVELIAGALSHPKVSRWQVEVTRRSADPWAPDEIYVLFQPRARADPSRVAIELHRSFADEVGIEPTQLVLSERAEDEVVDLRGTIREATPAATSD